MTKLIFKLKGGKGSGFHGHSGRPGLVGGSQSGRGSSYPEDRYDYELEDSLINDPDVLKYLSIPSRMYHVTSKKYIEDIKKNGLRSSRHRTSSEGYVRGVYLSDNPKEIAEKQGDIDIATEDLVVVVVNTKGLNLRLDPEFYTYYPNKKDALNYVNAINRGEELYAMYSKIKIPVKNIIGTIPYDKLKWDPERETWTA